MTTAVDFDAISSALSPDQFAAAIEAKKSRSGSYHCPGPGHSNGDQDPSLSITRKGGRTVACCHGCGLKGSVVQFAAELWGVDLNAAAERLAGAAGITTALSQNGNALGELIATYEYVDEHGEHLFEVVRLFPPKTFRQRVRQGPGHKWGLNGARRVLYRLPEVLEGIGLKKGIVITEGEKDADRLVALGAVATTNPGGAGKWRDEYTETLVGATVCIIPDNDEQGEAHAHKVAGALHGVAAEVRIVRLPDLPPRGDVSDWLDAGGTLERFRELANAVPVWEPEAKVSTAVETSPVPPSSADEHLTDMGNAQRLVRLHGDRIRYVRELGAWFEWDETRWAKDRTGAIERLAKATVRAMHTEALEMEDRSRAETLTKHAYRSESEPRLKAMISLARSEPGIPLTPEQLDADPWAFNVTNGTIDLRTGELRPHDQADLITKLAPVEYDPDATAPQWKAFLHRVLDGNEGLVGFIRRLAGYSLTGTTTEHLLAFLHGVGANGKSTLLGALLDVFGDYGMQSEPELLIQKRWETHPTGIADLKGARLVATTEIQAGRRMAEVVVKQLTGGDRVKARFMKKDFFEFEPTHTLWLSANHRPVVKGTDVAIWRRIRLIPFDVVIPPEEQDADLPEKLREELPGILAWAVRGCLEWQRDGLQAPAEVTAATQCYREDMDVLGGFIAEHCILGENEEVEAKGLYEKYKAWADVSGERKLPKNLFGQQLQDRGFETYKHSESRRITYRGIGLGKPSEATRSNLLVTPLENARVETNQQVASGTFADDKNGDADELPF